MKFMMPLTLVALILAVFTVAAGGPAEVHLQDPRMGAPSAGSGYVPPPTPTVDGVQMLAEHKAFVKAYPIRDGNTAQHVAARDALADEFAAAGYTLWRQNFVDGIAQQNVCAVKLGSVDPQTWVVIGGHLDSTTQDSALVGFPDPSPLHQISEGAYDDGSGVRMMMSLAKAWKNTNNAYSILWCGFDGEERGLQGSAQVRNAMVNDMLPGGFPWPVSDTRGMIEMDMYGLNWPLRAPIYVHENRAGIESWIDAARVSKGIPPDMLKFSDLRIAGVIALGSSDYIHWMNAGVPTAFFISDFNELGVPGTGLAPAVPVPGAPGAYPFWHFTDTWETMTVMAGGDATLLAGFQNAVDISGQTLALFALHPEVVL